MGLSPHSERVAHRDAVDSHTWLTNVHDPEFATCRSSRASWKLTKHETHTSSTRLSSLKELEEANKASMELVTARNHFWRRTSSC